MYRRSSRKMRSIWAESATITEFSISVLGADKQNWIKPILQSCILVGPPAVLTHPWSRTSPLSTSSVSSRVPPIFFTSLISCKSTLVPDLMSSQTPSTASTAMGASWSEYPPMTLEFSEVEAALIRLFRSLRSTGIAAFLRMSTDMTAAFCHALDMTLGCNPRDSRRSAAFRSAPAITTTLVVPSPASTSWAEERSISILAAGC
mmetsp:Transcript_35204/g.56839  ORF Transcript_35204/g.56839 Transcript_35204/m.56839 type:complete len:204 (+) Transcript_35204:919-1530(+)